MFFDSKLAHARRISRSDLSERDYKTHFSAFRNNRDLAGDEKLFCMGLDLSDPFSSLDRPKGVAKHGPAETKQHNACS